MESMLADHLILESPTTKPQTGRHRTAQPTKFQKGVHPCGCTHSPPRPHVPRHNCFPVGCDGNSMGEGVGVRMLDTPPRLRTPLQKKPIGLWSEKCWGLLREVLMPNPCANTAPFLLPYVSYNPTLIILQWNLEFFCYAWFPFSSRVLKLLTSLLHQLTKEATKHFLVYSFRRGDWNVNYSTVQRYFWSITWLVRD